MQKSKGVLFTGILTILLASYSNCGQVQFSIQKSELNSLQGPYVCDPFGGTTQAPKQGLLSNGVRYVDSQKLAAGESPGDVFGNSVLGFFDPANPKISSVDVDLFLQAINFPAMYFSQGFTDSSGNTLKTNSGDLLMEYFALRAKSNFVKGSWADGNYEIATITDDGSILTMTGAQPGGADYVINNDGHHSMKMGCSSNVIHVDDNSQIPLNFDYFQGPRTTIGMMMLYRSVPAGAQAGQDPACGIGGDSDSYFFLDHDANGNGISPSQAQKPYLDLVGRGWKVVEAEHFQLPGGITNPCAQ